MPIVDQAHKYPGHCLITGATTGPFFDFEYFLPDDEALVVHVDVIRAAFKDFGVVDKLDLDAAKLQIADLEAELVEANSQIVALTDANRIIHESGAKTREADARDSEGCRWCGTTESARGNPLTGRGLGSHERICTQNPLRVLN